MRSFVRGQPTDAVHRATSIGVIYRETREYRLAGSNPALAKLVPLVDFHVSQRAYNNLIRAVQYRKISGAQELQMQGSIRRQFRALCRQR